MSSITSAPASGNRGISQIEFEKIHAGSSPLQQIDLVGLHGLFVPEHGDQDPEPDGRFSHRHRDYEDGEDLPVHLIVQARNTTRLMLTASESVR